MAVLNTLHRYREVSTLGSGGMATVVLAQDTLLGREVALKRMHTAADPSGSSRLRREALVGASISHPNLVSIYDVVDSDEGDVVIVMEYVEGENLRDALARQGRLSPPEAVRILEGVAAGLDAIHARGIVHRDVKPANILLGAGGSVKLADLGIAAAPNHTRITTVGTVLGSFSYMAPEQLEDAPVTPAIDIYALGAVAFEALSGVPAHRESTPIAVAHAIATLPPPDLREAWPGAPPAAAELLLRAMARDPARRPGSAGELMSRLRASLEARETKRMAPRAALAAAGVAAGPVAATPAAAAVPAAPRAPRRAAPPPPDPPRRARALVPLALLAAAGVIVALLLAGGSKPRTTATRAAHSTPATTHHASTPARSTPAAAPPHSSSTTAPARSTSTTSTETSSAPSSTPPTAPPASGGASSPTAGVVGFYELAAAHRYAEAWALADPVFRSQLGGYDSFQQGQAGDRKIVFNGVQVLSQSPDAATVAIRTTSIRTDGTQHCQGTVQLRSSNGSGWMMHAISINCT